MKLIILDRDGVINQESDDYIRSADEWRPIPGSLEAIARLNMKGYRVVVITNQEGLALGKFDIEALNSMHRKMHNLLSRIGGSVEAILFCPHKEEDACSCRKPRPGLYQELAGRLRISMSGVFSIGDKLTDLKAAFAAGARPLLVRTGYGQALVDQGMVPEGVPVYNNLAAAVAEICRYE